VNFYKNLWLHLAVMCGYPSTVRKPLQSYRTRY